MEPRAHPGPFAALALVVLAAGFGAELSEAGNLVEDIGVLAIVGALTALAGIVPRLLTGADEDERPDAPVSRRP